MLIYWNFKLEVYPLFIRKGERPYLCILSPNPNIRFLFLHLETRPTVKRLKKVTEPDDRVSHVYVRYRRKPVRNLSETVTVNNSDTITEYYYNNQGRLVGTVETSDDAEMRQVSTTTQTGVRYRNSF